VKVTVKELIEELQKFDENLEVQRMTWGGPDWPSYPEEILTVKIKDKEWSLREGKYLDTNPIVVLN